MVVFNVLFDAVALVVVGVGGVRTMESRRVGWEVVDRAARLGGRAMLMDGVAAPMHLDKKRRVVAGRTVCEHETGEGTVERVKTAPGNRLQAAETNAGEGFIGRVFHFILFHVTPLDVTS